MKILILLILSCISGICYRVGGTSAGTKWRDLGVPVIATAFLLILGLKSQIWGVWGLIIAIFLHFGLLFAALTTYWKKKGTDAKWWNWLLHGLGLSLAILPVILFTGNWLGFLLRTLILTASITIWSEYTKWDVLEEWGRGFLIIASIASIVLFR
jgi:hypothetical protein